MNVTSHYCMYQNTRHPLSWKCCLKSESYILENICKLLTADFHGHWLLMLILFLGDQWSVCQYFKHSHIFCPSHSNLRFFQYIFIIQLERHTWNRNFGTFVGSDENACSWSFCSEAETNLFPLILLRHFSWIGHTMPIGHTALWQDTDNSRTIQQEQKCHTFPYVLYDTGDKLQMHADYCDHATGINKTLSC